MNSFMFWGLHTTTVGLTRVLYCLAKYPDMQQRCREEVAENVGLNYMVRNGDIPKLQYVSWFVKETLRFYPPIPELFRTLPAETVIGDYLVPKHTTLCFKVKDIHFNPDCWHDPETFDPLRFDPANSKDLHPYAYLAFSISPRNCIGENFAMNLMIVFIALIVRKFRIHSVNNKKEDMEEVTEEIEITVQDIL